MKGLLHNALIATLLISAVPTTSNAEIGFKTKLGLGALCAGALYTGWLVTNTMWQIRNHRNKFIAALEAKKNLVLTGKYCPPFEQECDLDESIKQYNTAFKQQSPPNNTPAIIGAHGAQPSNYIVPFSGPSRRLNTTQAQHVETPVNFEATQKSLTQAFDTKIKVLNDAKNLNTPSQALETIYQNKKATLADVWKQKIYPKLPEKQSVKAFSLGAACTATLAAVAYLFWGK